MRNERKFVAECLESIIVQLANRLLWEVICVDGMSSDGTREIVSRFAARDPRVLLLDNPHRTVPFGMNMGIRRARGDAIIRIDCHARCAPDYVECCLGFLERTGADNVGGYIDTQPETDGAVGRAIAAAVSSRFGVGGSAFRVGGDEREVDTVPFGCFRRDVFERFGLYDERLVRNQDIELNSRIRRGGGRIVISPTIRSTYYMRSTFRGLRQQAFNNGLWNPYALYLVGGGLRLRHFIPLGFILTLLLLALGGFVSPYLWGALAGVLGLYAAVGFTVALPLARQHLTSPFLLLLAFAQLHLAYGLGSLVGASTAPFKFGVRPPRRLGAACKAAGSDRTAPARSSLCI